MTLRRRLAIALPLLLAPAALAGAAQARVIKNPAALIIKTEETSSNCAQCGPNGTPMDVSGCRYAIFTEFPVFPGALQYRIKVRDGGEVLRLKDPPFQDDADGFHTPEGAHWFGPLTTGAGPPPCPSDPTENGRFKILRSVVDVGTRDLLVITGRVLRRFRGEEGPLHGVRVWVRLVERGPVGRMKTDRDGRFRFDLGAAVPGHYKVTVMESDSRCPNGAEGKQCDGSYEFRFEDERGSRTVTEHVVFRRPRGGVDRRGLAVGRAASL
jgi:hypothetical protein